MSSATVGTIEDALKRAEQLQIFPKAALRIQKVVTQENSSFRDLEQAVASDPALSGRLLRFANSPFYGLAKKVAGLRRALMVLGYRGTRDVALALAMTSMGRPNRPGRKEMMQHIIRTASLARGLGRYVPGMDDQVVFMAGIMHDVGTLILLEVDEPKMLSLLEEHLDESARVAAEREAFGFDHAELGRACMASWSLPEFLSEAVGLHHSPDLADHLGESDGRYKLAALIQIASDVEARVQKMGADSRAKYLMAHPCSAMFDFGAEVPEDALQIDPDDVSLFGG